MRTGISSYTYTWAVGVPGSIPDSPLSAFELIDKASASGINLVQIADNLPLENLPPDKLDELYRYSSEKGISIEMGGRGLVPDHTVKCLEAAAALHSPILRMVIDAPNFCPDIHSVISIIKELLPELQSRNIKLAIENHDRLKAREFEYIIQSAGSPFAGICLDSVNSMGAGEGFETVSEILIPYTINLHLKDFTVRRVSYKMGFVVEGTPAGKGMLKISELLSNPVLAGTCESAVLELWTPPAGDIEQTIAREELWAQESISYLKSLNLNK